MPIYVNAYNGPYGVVGWETLKETNEDSIIKGTTAKAVDFSFFVFFFFVRFSHSAIPSSFFLLFLKLTESHKKNVLNVQNKIKTCLFFTRFPRPFECLFSRYRPLLFLFYVFVQSLRCRR